ERVASGLPGLVRPVRRWPVMGGGVVERGRGRASPCRLVAGPARRRGRRPLPPEAVTMLALRGRGAEGGIPAHRERPPENRPRPPPPPRPVRRGFGRAAHRPGGIGRGRGGGLQRDGPVRRGRPARARRRRGTVEGA